MGLFLEPKWRLRATKSGSPKSLKNRSKQILIFDHCWGPIGVPNGARKVQIRAPKSDLASWGGPGFDLGAIFCHFGTYFEMILVWIFDISQRLDLCI